MATTQNTYTGNGSTTNYSFTFPYLETTDIKVSLNGVLTTAYTLANATTVAFNTAPANGAAIRIYRVTGNDSPKATFYPGSAIRSQDLNDNVTQILYSTQENTNYGVQDAGNVTLNALYTFTYSPSGPTPTSSAHLATKGYVDGIALAGTVPDGDRGDITVSSTGTVWTIDNLAVTAAKIANSTITTAKLAFTPLQSSDLGTTVQAYDVDTAKTDVAQTFTAAQRGSYVTLTDAATIAVDLSLGNNFQVTLGGNRTLGAPTNVVAGQSGVIRVVQDGTGSRTLAYNSVYKFAGGTAPTLTTTASAVDLLAYHVESGTRIAVRFIGDVK
jgi:hypothetical protein